MKKYAYLLSSVSAVVILGCGSSSVSDTDYTYDTSSIFEYSKEIKYKNYVVRAEDDAIVNATIKATNCESFEEIGDGEYLLKKCIAKPLYIEVKNGTIKDRNVIQDFPLLLNVAKTNRDDDFVITPLTTILATATDKEINKLADKLGVKKEDLFSDTNDKVKKLLPKINAVAIAAASGGAVTNKIKFLQVLKDEVIDKTDSNGDLDVKETLKDIREKSISSPHLFGLVIIDDSNINNDDPLESLAKMQNSKVVRLYGLVFDKGFEANISIKDLDDNTSFSDINATSDDSGAWSLSIDENSDLYKTIMNKNHILQFTAVKDDNESIKLTSTISTYKLRSLINNTKLISASKEKNLIISNVTTAEDAILDKRGALNSKHYDGNLSELRVYYQDKVVKAAAIIKNVIDANASINDDVNNTYELVKNSIISYDTPELDINTSVVDYNASLENNITNDTILSSQLNDISNDIIKNSNKEEVDKFKEVAENAGYVFYRLLAYYKDNNQTDENFVREYTKIIVYPSHYETKTCYLYGNVYDTDWNCDKPKIVENNSNFTLGYYQVNEENSTITYSLDFNDSVYVKDLNKSYSYYGVIKSDTNLSSGKVSTEPMILVDSYDVVDAFRRLPDEDKEKFEELKDKVKDKSRTEVNYELNRWVKDFMDDVEDYYSDENSSN